MIHTGTPCFRQGRGVPVFSENILDILLLCDILIVLWFEGRNGMKKTLIVVDMQNDFIDMALGTKEAVEILPKVQAKIRQYAEKGYEIIYTRDTHEENYLNTP